MRTRNGIGDLLPPSSISRDRRAAVRRLGLAATLWAAAITFGGDEPRSPAAAPPDTPAFLGQVAERYRALNTYQDEITIKLDVERTSEAEELMGDTPARKCTLAWRRPGDVALRGDYGTVIAWNGTIWTHNPRLKQYKAESMSGEELADAFAEPMNTYFLHPVALVLMRSGSTIEEIFPEARQLSGPFEDVRDGKSWKVVRGTYEPPSYYTELPLTFVARFDEQLLLREIVFDVTDAMNKRLRDQLEEEDEDEAALPESQPVGSAPANPVTRAEWRISLDGMRCNEPPPTDAFVFKPGEKDRLVERFEYSAGSDGPGTLIGKPAPAFSGTALDGQPISLEALRGRVVMLDFWAIWCGPCVKALPHVQKVAEHFADKEVTVIGVNRDQAGSAERVRKFLEKRGVKFRQFLDPEGETARNYEVSGIPCTVLIDREGVIRDAHTGFSSDVAEALTENIDKLLRGEALPPRPPPIAMQHEDEEADNAVSPLAEVAPERLVAGRRSTAPGVGSRGLRPFDLDGDGRFEWVGSGWNGNLLVMGSDGEKLREVELKNFGSKFQITDFQPVRDAAGLRWLVGGVSYGRLRGSSALQVGLYSDDGARLWLYKPEWPADREVELSLATGDLDGDGRREFVIGISSHALKKTGENNYLVTSQMGHLVVLDADGKCLTTKKLGERIQHVAIADSPNQGATREILCLTDGKLRRYRFDVSAAAAAKPVEAGGPAAP